MIAAEARYDLLLLGAAEDVVVEPDELDVGLVGVRAGHAVKDPAHAETDAADDALRELDHRLVRVAGIGVVVGKLQRLRVDSVGDFLPSVADIYAIEAGERVDAAPAVAIDDGDPLAAGDDPARRLAACELGEVGRWVKD